MAIIEIIGGPITHKYLMGKTKHELADMYMRLLRDTARDAEDAERYRWLKCNCQHMPDELGIAGQLYFGTYAWGDLDTAIDAAMTGGLAG